jgi:hypothetical protein
VLLGGPTLSFPLQWIGHVCKASPSNYREQF